MQKTIGVFFGSGSPEHDVSIITAQLIIATLKKLNYPVVPVYITKEGKWLLGEELGSLKVFADPNFKPSEEKKFFEYVLDLENSRGKMVFQKKGLLGKTITVDLAFPALHGSFGEDGTMQGLFEMFGLPYVGCDVPASAISMDKALTKIVIKDANIPVTNFVWFERRRWEEESDPPAGGLKLKSEINALKFPLFVKPVHLGSSIGIGKAKDEKELQQKVDVALYYDNKVIVEEAVEEVMDVTCCVIGNVELTASVLQESIFGKDLLDFDDKYLKDGGAQTGQSQQSVVIPARLSEAETKAIQETAKKVYRALGLSGIARVDFLYDKKTKKFYANEVNPMPGTLYHHLWKASGLETEDLVKKLIALAEEKYAEKRKITYTFESDILKNLKGGKLSGSKL
jgi:D-alanine-D-alanine ligase